MLSTTIMSEAANQMKIKLLLKGWETGEHTVRGTEEFPAASLKKALEAQRTTVLRNAKHYDVQVRDRLKAVRVQLRDSKTVRIYRKIETDIFFEGLQIEEDLNQLEKAKPNLSDMFNRAHAIKPPHKK